MRVIRSLKEGDSLRAGEVLVLAASDVTWTPLFPRAIAVVTGLLIRLMAMSGWFMWTLAGIFDNVGVVQESMETIARPHTVVDQPGEAGSLLELRLAVEVGVVRQVEGALHIEPPVDGPDQRLHDIGDDARAAG